MRQVDAADGGVAAAPLTNLITWSSDMAAEPREAIARLAASIADDLADAARRETARYTPDAGLVVAATPPPGSGSRPSARQRGDVAALLHQQAADWLLAERAVEAAVGHPVVTGVMVIRPELRDEPLVSEWLSGLYPVEPQQRSQLGFHLLNELRPAPADRPMTSVAQWCAHHGSPDLWAVITADGTVYATVGSSVPASGGLIEAAVTDHAAFFRDTAGQVWPLPRGRHTIYSGAWFPGNQPRTLAAVLTRLTDDAAADVADIDPATHPVDPLIRESVRGQDFPLRITFPDTTEAASHPRTTRAVR